MTRVYKWDVLSTAWIKLINDGGHFVGPYLLHSILTFIADPEAQDDRIGYLYAVGMVLSSALQAFAMAHYFQMGYRTGLRLISAVILLEYKKALRLVGWEQERPPAPAETTPNEQAVASRRCPPWRRNTARPAAAQEQRWSTVGGIGQLTNLISADTDKFLFLMPYFNLCWSAPLQLVICFSMLAAYVGWALFAGIATMACFMMFTTRVQLKAAAVQKQAMKAKDARLKMEVELLKIVKIIKFYAWETTIEDKVRELRDEEMRLQLKYKLWSIGFFLSFSLSPSVVALSTFAAYVGLGNELKSATAFTALSLFNILTFPLGAMPMMLRFFTEAAVSAGRIESFLLMDEVADRPRAPADPTLAIELTSSVPGTLKWPDGTDLLQDVSPLQFKKGEFCVVVGRTGAGKSGLLYSILGEIPFKGEGADAFRLGLSGKIGYCAQTAWVQNATLRDNVTGGLRELPPDGRYEQVLDACALSQDLQSLQEGDLTLIGDRGINLSGGQKQRVALARAVFADPDIFILDDVLSALDAHVASHIIQNLFKGPLFKGKTVVLVTHSAKALPLADKVLMIEDKKIAFTGTFEEFQNSPLSNHVQFENPDETAEVAAEEALEEQKDDKGKGGKNGNATSKSMTRPVQEERRSGSVSWPVYKAYIRACGGVVPVGIFVLSVIFAEGSKNATDAWLSHWSNSGGFDSGIAIYAGFVLLGFFGGISYVVSRVFVGQNGSRVLHEKVVHSLLRAKMSFFDKTPAGQITNRLAEDTNILDYNLPQTMGANFVWFWRSAAIVVICMFVGWYLFILIVPMFYLYYKLAKRYLPATRDLRRLDLAARSPIFHHFGETINGMTTIRAMNRQNEMVINSVQRLEQQMEAYYLSNTAARWLSLRLQFNGTILIGAVCMLSVYLCLNGGMNAGIVGLAITYAMKLTDTLSQVNRESADRETQMVSVERVESYSKDISSEAALVLPDDRNLPENWPSRGEIVLQNVVMRYRDDLPPVLKGVSLKICEREHVGIVGRTGCGKSSLLLTLMRLVELESGTISIDGADASKLGLHTLRSKAAIIPQDPAILPGTVRYNLDPFKTKSDEELWSALSKAQLQKRIESADGGLDSKVEEGGGNFSVGELQLLCLARALLAKQKVGGLLLLDEATSALDSETDQIIQTVIRKEFDCTIITIAHRIQTLMDYHKIIVLHEGSVAEEGSPEELLRNPESAFRSLAKEAGIPV
jgi:ABC-type multidrug transport system fused ATPase/permease subunit